MVISEFGLDKRKKGYSEEKLSQLAQIQHTHNMARHDLKPQKYISEKTKTALTTWHHFSDS